MLTRRERLSGRQYQRHALLQSALEQDVQLGDLALPGGELVILSLQLSEEAAALTLQKVHLLLEESGGRVCLSRCAS